MNNKITKIAIPALAGLLATTAAIAQTDLQWTDASPLRPIFMSVGTGVLGMLPLALSTFLTPTVVPALMGLTKDAQFKNDIKIESAIKL